MQTHTTCPFCATQRALYLRTVFAALETSILQLRVRLFELLRAVPLAQKLYGLGCEEAYLRGALHFARSDFRLVDVGCRRG
jgi:hypothetical protein